MAKQNSFLGFHRFGLKRTGLLQAELQLSFTTSYFTALLQGITNKSMIGQRRDDFLKDPFTCEEQNHLIAANWRVYKFWRNRLKAAEPVLKANAADALFKFYEFWPEQTGQNN